MKRLLALVVALATAALPLYRVNNGVPMPGLPRYPLGVVASAMGRASRNAAIPITPRCH